MIGLANEVDLDVNGVSCLGLLDTGSQITSVASWFVEKYFPDVTIDPIEEFIQIKGASGSSVGFHGVVILDIEVVHTSPKVIIPTPTVVVNDTLYNSRVPFIIGTNLLQMCELQKDQLPKPWKRAMSCISAEVTTTGAIGPVISLKQTVIPANSKIQISGSVRAGPVGRLLVTGEEGVYGTLPIGLALPPVAQYITSY